MIIHKTRSWETSKYVKVIAISQEDYDFIYKNKGRKSLAGMLEIIIKFYKDKKYE